MLQTKNWVVLVGDPNCGFAVIGPCAEIGINEIGSQAAAAVVENDTGYWAYPLRKPETDYDQYGRFVCLAHPSGPWVVFGPFASERTAESYAAHRRRTGWVMELSPVNQDGSL